VSRKFGWHTVWRKGGISIWLLAEYFCSIDLRRQCSLSKVLAVQTWLHYTSVDSNDLEGYFLSF
jgi:hypothetical protein